MTLHESFPFPNTSVLVEIYSEYINFQKISFSLLDIVIFIDSGIINYVVIFSVCLSGVGFYESTIFTLLFIFALFPLQAASSKY